MEYAVVTVEYAQQKRRDLALPVNVRCQVLANALVRALEQPAGESYSLALQTAEGIRSLPPNACLYDLGILCGAALVLQTAEHGAVLPQGSACFRTANGSLLPLAAAEISVGRSDPAHGIFADLDLSPYDLRKYTSRRHAVVECRDGDTLLTDVGSSHGTFVNGKRLGLREPCRLQDGDTVEFGLASKGGVLVTFHAGRG
jgi:hypothetical protein